MLVSSGSSSKQTSLAWIGEHVYQLQSYLICNVTTNKISGTGTAASHGASIKGSSCACRPVNALELLKYQDLSKAVTNLLHRVPGINQQTAQVAIQQTLGDEDAAAAFLTAALSETHMPSSGDPNTMASLLLQNLPPGFHLPANSGEVVQAMAAAMAKASELQLATDRLAVAAIQSQQQIKVLLWLCLSHPAGMCMHRSNYQTSSSWHCLSTAICRPAQLRSRAAICTPA